MDSSRPPHDKKPLSPIHEQPDKADSEETSSQGKSGTHRVSKHEQTPAQSIPDSDDGTVVRRQGSKRSSRPTTFQEGAGPLDSSLSPLMKSTEESPSSFRSRSQTIGSSHHSETELLWSQLSEASKLALEEMVEMREGGVSLPEFAQALANAGEDSEGVNTGDVIIPESIPHEIVSACDLRSETSLLAQCLPIYNLQASSLPDYEKERLSHLACCHLARFPAALQDKVSVQQCLTRLPVHHTTCFQQLLPTTSDTLLKAQKKLTIPCEASLKEILQELGLDLKTPASMQLCLLIQITLTVLHTSCYQQLLKKDYNYQIMRRETEAIIKAWQALEKNIPARPEGIMTAIRVDKANALAMLQKHRDMLQTLEENDFRCRTNFQRSISLINEAALSLLVARETECPDQKEAVKKVEDHIMQLAQVAFAAAPGVNAVARLRGYESRIKSALGKVRLKSDYPKALAQALKKNCARPYEKKLVLSINGELHRATVHYEPAACIRIPPASDDPLEELASLDGGNYDPFKKNYKNEFCPSVIRNESDHCVNLMIMTVTLDDAPPETACFYKEIRVGIPYPFAVEGSMQKETEDLRWDEILTTSLLLNQKSDLQASMADPNHAPIKLPVMYNCLLSPDKGRPLVKFLPFMDPEIQWCERTREKVDQINAKGIRTLTIRDCNGIEHQVRVKPDIKMLINPCNEMVYNPVFNKTGAWVLADEVTASTLTKWLGPLDSKQEPKGEVGQFLQQKDIDPTIRQEIQELALEVRRIFSSKEHHTLSLQPFLFSDMVTELGRLLGYANVTGCKSAKDRTGEKSENDIRFAFNCHFARERNKATKIPTSIIPYLWMPLTEEDYFNALQCNLNSGQEENCQNNTGIPGRKVPRYMLGPAQENFAFIDRHIEPEKQWLKEVPTL